MLFYKEGRLFNYKWFLWLNENKSFNELCEEIDFFKDIKQIS